MISAEIIKDSTTPGGNRLTTFLLTYPRFIHAEFMTHRCFSRNASSSRAIPIQKMIEAVQDTYAAPEFWGKNQSGMQALEQLTGPQKTMAETWWDQCVVDAVTNVQYMAECGADLHKQIANRVLEPFSHITVIATASEKGLRNFFALRAHKDAQPEFQVLAYRMLHPYLHSIPNELEWNQWHTPFDKDIGGNFDELRLKICTGRIARVSYLTHDGIRDPDSDITLHDRLKDSGHWSPFEHCAKASQAGFGGSPSNFGPNWFQYRKQFYQECGAPTDEHLWKVLEERPTWFNL